MAALAACEPLPHLQSNQCGNHIIEPGEDCDGAGIGPSSCSATCRLECASGVDACPAGWGCGGDGLCRQPQGKLSALGSGLPISADRLTLADFDGDGKRDVLATRGTSLSIAYLDEHGLLPESTTLSISPIDDFVDAPGVGDLDGDGRADLALRVGRDLGVLRGQSDRTLIADAFTRDPGLDVQDGDALIALDIDTRSDAPGDEILAYGNGALRVVRTQGQMPSGPLFTWGAGSSLSRPPALVQVNGARMLLVSIDGDDHVTLLSPLVSDPSAVPAGSQVTWNVESGGKWVVSPQVITLPTGGTVQGGAFLYSLTSSYDLLIRGKLGGQDQYFVSFYSYYYSASVYQQGYHSSPYQGCSCATTGCCTGVASSGTPSGATLFSVMGDVQASEPTLLAGTLTTGVTGLVTEQGIYTIVCQNNGCYTPIDGSSLPDPSLGFKQTFKRAVSPGGGTWTSVLSFGAGVIAATADPGFTFYRAEGGAWNPFQIPTQSAPQNLVVGDFNGDGTSDLLFTQISARAPTSDPTLQSLHASFGDPYGIPGAATDLGDVGHVGWLLSERDTSNPDGISDCLAHTTGAAAGATPYYLFDGSTDRQLESPLVLRSNGCAGDPIGVARYSAVGRFSGAASADVATIYRVGDVAPYTYEIHSVVPDSGDSAALCKAAPASVALSDPGSDELTLLPIDLAGAGTDQLLIFPKGGSKLFVASVASGKWSLETVDLGQTYQDLTTAALGAGPAGKHLSDVVLWSASGVTVLWNDGNGALDPGSSAQIPIAAGVCPGSDTTPRGVAAINFLGHAERQLLVVTGTDTLVASLADPAARTFAPPTCASSETGGGGDAVTTGDVNGDGVDDLVLTRPGGLQVFTGIPVNP